MRHEAFPAEGLPLSALPTPCLLLDGRRFLANARRLTDRWAGTGLVLRPHLKTCRSLDLVKLAMGADDCPCAVATLDEARAAAARGARDLLLTVGIRPGLFAGVRELMSRGVRLTVLLDSPAMARALAGEAKATGARFRVLIEIDCDSHRAGLAPDDPRLPETAAILAEAGQDLAGVLTHAGAVYAAPDTDHIRALALREAEAAGRAARRLREAGHACPVVSAGSTPTALLADTAAWKAAGVTEVRAGVWIFMDLVMAGLGVCSPDDIALSVLCSVAGGFPEEGRIPARLVTDAGWAALSQDRGLERRFADWGYGLVCDAGGRRLEGLVVRELNQEHGMIEAGPDLPAATRDFLARVTPWTRLRILPAHACAAAMPHALIHMVRDGRAEALFPRFGAGSWLSADRD